MTRSQYHLSVDGPATAVALLREASGLPAARIKHAMTRGAVWLTRGRTTRRLRRATRELRVGETLHLYYDERVLGLEPPEPTLIADGGGYSVWNKPPGMLSQGSKWDYCTLARWAERHLEPQRPAFVVHRLDRAARGLMVLAHTRTAAARLAAAFRERRVEKRYAALVAGEFRPENVPLPIDEPIEGRPARSLLFCARYDPQSDCTVLTVEIETGRKHQVRRHLAGVGAPILGDRLHGVPPTDRPVGDLQLVAVHLAFDCPTSEERRCFEIPPELSPPPRRCA